MWSRPSFADVWDMVLFSVLLPVVLVMGVSLPGDWAHHNGDSLAGTATVTRLERIRGGDVVVVDVHSTSGEVVARDQEVNGDTPDQVGAAFAVSYLPPDEAGSTQVYASGHDPFENNAAVSFGRASGVVDLDPVHGGSCHSDRETSEVTARWTADALRRRPRLRL